MACSIKEMTRSTMNFFYVELLKLFLMTRYFNWYFSSPRSSYNSPFFLFYLFLFSFYSQFPLLWLFSHCQHHQKVNLHKVGENAQIPAFFWNTKIVSLDHLEVSLVTKSDITDKVPVQQNIYNNWGLIDFHPTTWLSGTITDASEMNFDAFIF